MPPRPPLDVHLHQRRPRLAVDPELEDIRSGLVAGGVQLPARPLFDEILKRREVKLSGSTALRRSFPGWLGLSLFAVVDRPLLLGARGVEADRPRA